MLIPTVLLSAATAVATAAALTAAAEPPPSPVRPNAEIVSLAKADAVGSAREVNYRRGFSMIGVRWQDARPGRIEVQARGADGAWRGWKELEPIASAPDGTPAAKATEPIWVGDSRGVRVRSDVDPALLEVVLIDPGQSQADAEPVQTQVVGKPTVISRAAWGADESLRLNCSDPGPEYMTTIKAATVHHTAGTNDYTQADSAAIVRGIYYYHARTQGWCDIGYNALVDKYGQIFEGTFGGLERAVKGAHAGGFNNYTFGISMMGLYTAEAGVTPTAVQLESVSQMIAWKLGGNYRNPLGQVTLVSTGGGTSRYPAGTPVTLPVIFAHRDVGATDCPGDLGYQQMTGIRSRVSQLVGDWTASPVYQKWQALGGENGPIGSPHRLELPALNGGLSTLFSGGSWSEPAIYWSPATGAHEVYGPIRARWAELGWEQSYLGYPIRGQYAVSVGVRSDFQRGYIVYDTTTGQFSDRPYWRLLPRTAP